MYKSLAIAALVSNTSAVDIKNTMRLRSQATSAAELRSNLRASITSVNDVINAEDKVQQDSWSRIRAAIGNDSTPSSNDTTPTPAPAPAEDDSNINWISQTAVSKTCDGSIQRMRDEDKGSIKVPSGEKFNDISFTGSDAIDWTTSTTATWKRPSEIETSPSLWGSKGIRPAAIN
jgi:hypothetical protein